MARKADSGKNLENNADSVKEETWRQECRFDYLQCTTIGPQPGSDSRRSPTSR